MSLKKGKEGKKSKKQWPRGLALSYSNISSSFQLFLKPSPNPFSKPFFKSSLQVHLKIAPFKLSLTLQAPLSSFLSHPIKPPPQPNVVILSTSSKLPGRRRAVQSPRGNRSQWGQVNHPQASSRRRALKLGIENN